MIFHYVPHDAQTESSAAGLFGAGLVDPVEALEDAGEGLLGDTDARVRDAHDDLALVRIGGNLDAPAYRGVLYGVLHEVGEHRGELRLVAADGVCCGPTGALPGEGDVLAAGGWPVAGEHDHQDAPEVHRLGVLDPLFAL